MTAGESGNGHRLPQGSSAQTMLIAVTYHYVRPGFAGSAPGIYGITPGELETQLRLLGTVGEFVSIAQVRAAVRDRGRLPPRALLVTLDDGLREQVDHALPVLDRLGIPAVFFVNTWPIANRAISTVHKIHLLRANTSPTNFYALLQAEGRRQGIEVGPGVVPAAAAVQYPWDSPESAQLKYFLNHELAPDVKDAIIGPCFRHVFGDAEEAISGDLYMDIERLRELGARGYLGTHGHRHVHLGRLSRPALQENVRTSLDTLVQWTGVRPFALAYPFGSLEASRVEAAAVAEAGVELAFTMERAANVDLDRPLHLARFDCNELPAGRQPSFTVHSLFDSAPWARWHREMPEPGVPGNAMAAALKET
ncbi:MAG: hypothetical protein E6J20_01120 [Chloroflexi bacterium]|nr:MAG: hypothetical protein E6J20_01120 [Chloroflexota bacterium]